MVRLKSLSQKDIRAGVPFPSQLFPVLATLPLNTIVSAQEKTFLPLMTLPAWAAMGLGEARQKGNAIRIHSKEGTLAVTDKRGHSPATPGEEGGRNHKHPFPFLHQEGRVVAGHAASSMAPSLGGDLCCPHIEGQDPERKKQC